jgi:DNA-binding transcriptional MerR regulator
MDLRAQVDVDEIAAKIQELKDQGVYLQEIVTLTPAEEAKFPPNEWKKQRKLKELRMLKDKSIYLKKMQTEKEKAAKELKKTQELLDLRMQEVADLHMKIEKMEKLLKMNPKDF